MTLDGGHKSGLLTADESACTEAKTDIELEAGSEDVVTQEAVLSCLLDGDLKTLNGDRVLGTNVNVTLRGTDGVTCDSHGLKNYMRVALENGTIHECTRVALVGVTAHILLISLVSLCEHPLTTGRETCATAAAETGVKKDLDDIIRSLLGQHLCKSLVTARSDVLVNVLGIDDTAVAQRHTILLLIEIRLVHRDDAVRGNRLLIEILGYDVTVYKVLGNDLRNVLDRHISVESSLRINDNDRAESAEAMAAGAYDAYVVLESVLLDLVVKCDDDVFAVGGSTAGTAAHKDMMLVVLALRVQIGDLGFALAAHRNDAFLLRLNLVKFRDGYHLLPPVTRILQGFRQACRRSACRILRH